MTTERGWISFAPGQETAHLSADERAAIEQRIAARRAARGRLLASVEVQVFENGSDAQVSFPAGSVLGPESDAELIEQVVVRACAELKAWR